MGICHQYVNEINALLNRNSGGDPAGAKQFLVWIEELGANQRRVTFGVGERVGTEVPVRYRFVADPAPAVIENAARQVLTGGEVTLGGAVSMPFAVSVTPDPPEEPFLVSATTRSGYLAWADWASESDPLPRWFDVESAPLTIKTACKVKLHGSSSLACLATCTDFDTQTCTCSCCDESTWSFYLRASGLEEVDLVVGQ
jgi:hypothetical protein